MKLDIQNIESLFINFYKAINTVLNRHSIHQKIKKFTLKMKTKVWIIAGIQNYIKIKNKVFKYFISKNDITLKNEYKKYRICSPHLLKNYYNKFFKNKLNDLENISKGIRNSISMNKSALFLPTLLS